MVLVVGDIHSSKAVIVEEDIDVEGRVGVGASETGTRGGGRNDGVDRRAVRRVFRAKVRGVSLSKPRKW